jgi:hypothetical protein
VVSEVEFTYSGGNKCKETYNFELTEVEYEQCLLSNQVDKKEVSYDSDDCGDATFCDPCRDGGIAATFFLVLALLGTLAGFGVIGTPFCATS